MGWFDGWPFKSQAQMKKEQAEYEKKLLPFGEEQRDAADKVLAQVTGPKLKDRERMYLFLAAKEKFLTKDTEEEALDSAGRFLMDQSWLPRQDARMILAFALLEYRAPSLEEYPTAEIVRQEAEKL